MWEWYSEHLKWRLGMTIVGVIFISMLMSCNELRYMIWSKTIDAQLLETRIEKNQRRGVDYVKRVAKYGFQDGEKYRFEFADVDLDWEGQFSPTVKIQYIPTKDRASRIVGQTHNGIWVFIFLATLALGVGWVVTTWMKAYK